MENQQPSNGKKAIEQELTRGRDTANQLLEELLVHILNTHYEDVEGLILTFVEDLARKVLRSFINTLFLLNTNNDVSNENVLPFTIKDFSSVNCPKLEDTDKACKSFFNAKNRRGCYKRKSNALTWEKDSTILIEDGYVWRKYGQKRIMNAKYLRSYYRCTYKDDQDCPAIKQVQRIQEDPPLYRTTYYGHHNCERSLNSEMTLEPNTSSGSSLFLSFNSSLPSKDQYSFSSSHFASTKQEPMEVIPNYHIAHSELTSSDYPLSCDNELDVNNLRHATMLSSSTKSVQFENVCGHSLDFDC